MRFTHLLPTALVALTTLPSTTTAIFRMVCPSRLIDARMDPIISPGNISAHMHTVAGGNGFGYSMDYDQARASSCTSCSINEDLSNWWSPTLYFRFPNGSFTAVKHRSDTAGTGGSGPQLGGPTVYYVQAAPAGVKIKAWPAGLRMIAGNPFTRNFTGTSEAMAIQFKCIQNNMDDSTFHKGLPTIHCEQGIRAMIWFPSCWDGKNLDSPDHKSHMAYAEGPHDGAFKNGTCPSSHPVQMLTMFTENVYDTQDFAQYWSAGDQQPFTLSNGDATGYGYHADFYNGWDVNVLQAAIDDCDNAEGSLTACKHFTLNTAAAAQACKIPATLNTRVHGVMDLMPGCNDVTRGPAPALIPATCARVPTISAPKQPFSNMLKQGYAYVGCAYDEPASRTLSTYSKMTENMTVAWCVETCKSQKQSYAGLGWGKRCFCGNSVAPSRMPSANPNAVCNMPCAGAGKELCGGFNGVSLYEACGAGGAACKNDVITIAGKMPGSGKVKRERRRKRDVVEEGFEEGW